MRESFKNKKLAGNIISISSKKYVEKSFSILKPRLFVSCIFFISLSHIQAATSFQVEFINTNDSISASMLNSMGASAGQVMKYNGLNWVATNTPNAQNYLGVWNANSNTPNLTTPSSTSGDYYIVSVAGTFNAMNFSIGDWIISDGTSWQKLSYSYPIVESFNGRSGAVTLIPGDYVTLKNGAGKLPGSSINDFADADILSPVNGSILKFNSGDGKWYAGNDSLGVPLYTGTANRAVLTDGAGALATSNVTSAELNYLTGVTGPIQAQLNSKLTGSLANGKMYVGSGSSEASEVAMSGDATMTNTGVLSLKNTGTPGTYTSVTTDVKGRVTAGSNPATAAITELTGDVTASGYGPVVATIATGSVNSAKILDTSLLPSDFDFTGTNIGTSGLVINNLAGGFTPLVCATAGHVPTWTLTGFACQAGGSGSVSGTAGKIAKFTASTVAGDSILSESGTTVSLSGVLALPTTSSTVGYVTQAGFPFLHAYKGTYLGDGAGNFTSTGENTGIGYLTLQELTSGDNNTVVGMETGDAIETGSENTIVGVVAGGSLVNGNKNTYIGRGAGSSRPSGTSNVYIGNSAGSLWTGVRNTLVGESAGGNTALFGGSSCIFLGQETGLISSGSVNVFLGYKAGASVTTGSSNVIIGGNNGALIASSSNNFLLSDGAGTLRMRIKSNGNVGIGADDPNYKLQVGVAGDLSEARANAWNSFSDERLKKDFELIPQPLEKLLSLNGYYYHWKNNLDHSRKMGVKAQEVKKVFPEVVSRGADGLLSVSYNHLVAGVIEAIKSFHFKWSQSNVELTENIKVTNELWRESEAEFNTNMAHKLKVIKSLKQEKLMLQSYLCSKDPDAEFCK